MGSEIKSSSVGGEYYPQSREDLLSLMSELETEAKHWIPKVSGRISGLIVPHAGYLLSGKTAMAGYLALKGKDIENFLLIGPKHDAPRLKTAVFPSGDWKTPLGDVDIDKQVSNYLLNHKTIFSSDVKDKSGDYSLDLQMPFLQYTLNKRFSITPMVMGNREKKEAVKIAETLYDLDLKIPLIISTDLNHYEKLYTTIRKDSLLIDAILSLDVNRLYRVVEKDKVSVCGYGPIAVLMEYTRLLDGQIEMVDHSTSYHYSGDMEKVVGYASLLATY